MSEQVMFRGLVGRLMDNISPERDANTLLIIMQIGAACYPNGAQAEAKIKCLQPRVSQEEVWRVTEAFVDYGVGTLDDLFQAIWRMDIAEYMEKWMYAVAEGDTSCIATANSPEPTPTRPSKTFEIEGVIFRINPAAFSRIGMNFIDMELIQKGNPHIDCSIRFLTDQAHNVMIVAEDLGMPVTHDEAMSISRNNLTPSLLSEPALLSSRERVVAEEIYYYAWLSIAKIHGWEQNKETMRARAKAQVECGERGRTAAMKVGAKMGCLVMVVIAATSLLSLPIVIISVLSPLL